MCGEGSLEEELAFWPTFFLRVLGRSSLGLLFFTLLFLTACGLREHPEYPYQQQISLLSKNSKEELVQRVELFKKEAKKDPEVEFRSVKYYQEGVWHPVYYADVLCDVKFYESSLGGIMARVLSQEKVHNKPDQ